MSRHEEIIAGVLSFPEQIKILLNANEEQMQTVREYWESLWHNFLNEDASNGLFWADVFKESGLEKMFLQLNFYLEKAGWIEMEISSAFCAIRMRDEKILKWVTKKELLNIRKMYKFMHYKMRCNQKGSADLVKIGNGKKRTGLVRCGFQKAGRHKFYYDSLMIKKWQKEITEEVTKKLISGVKDVDYKEIVKHLITEYIIDDGPYTLGPNVSDSRGRAIFDCTKRVFNPISHKTARASVVMPKPEKLTDEGWKAVYLFVAELNHVKEKTIEDKAAKGKELVENETISKKCDLHEKIWLERIYQNVREYGQKGWDVPIEVD